MMIFIPYREVPHDVGGHVSVAVPRMPALSAEIRTSEDREVGFCPKMEITSRSKVNKVLNYTPEYPEKSRKITEDAFEDLVHLGSFTVAFRNV
jgi:hypothetical protein